MSEKQLSAIGGSSFERLKQINPYGAEYCSASNLPPYRPERRSPQTCVDEH